MQEQFVPFLFLETSLFSQATGAPPGAAEQDEQTGLEKGPSCLEIKGALPRCQGPVRARRAPSQGTAWHHPGLALFLQLPSGASCLASPGTPDLLSSPRYTVSPCAFPQAPGAHRKSSPLLFHPVAQDASPVAPDSCLW